jgi:MFS transporter, DHA3 family, macrolide efflux protein
MIDTLSVGMGPIGSMIFVALFVVVNAEVIFLSAGLLLFMLILWLVRWSKMGVTEKLVHIRN